MKKYLLILALAGCSSYQNTKLGVGNPEVDINKAPSLNANVAVGEKITGKASCQEILFIKSKPYHQTYGINLQITDIEADSSCVAGAIYDAMNKNNADVLIAPSYTVIRDEFLCIPYTRHCIYSNTEVLVSGFSGKLNIK
jgi:hypothetical protein